MCSLIQREHRFVSQLDQIQVKWKDKLTSLTKKSYCQEEQYHLVQRKPDYQFTQENHGGIPTCKCDFINPAKWSAPGLSYIKIKQVTYEARTPGQDFKIQIYVALRYDLQVDTLKLIESIKDDDSPDQK